MGARISAAAPYPTLASYLILNVIFLRSKAVDILLFAIEKLY